MYLQKGYDGEKRGMTRPMDKETVANFNLQMASGAKYSTNSKWCYMMVKGTGGESKT